MLRFLLPTKGFRPHPSLFSMATAKQWGNICSGILLVSLLLGCFSNLAAQEDFPAETIVCRQGPFTLESPVPGVWHYQWERSFDGGTSWFPISEATSSSLLINDPTAGISYRLRYALSPVCLADPTCASLTTATRLLVQIPIFYQTALLCEGDSLLVGTAVLTTGGTHLTRFDRNGCDSLVSTFVLLQPQYNQVVSVTLCPGEAFEGVVYTAATNFTRFLTASTGCDSTVHYEIQTSFPADLAILGPRSICEGETATLSVLGIYPSIEWSNGSNGRSIEVSQAATYQLRLQNSRGCTLLLTHSLEVVRVEASVLSQASNCPGTATGSLRLEASGDDDLLYSFDGGLTFSTDNNAYDLAAGTYELLVESPLGCQWSGEGTVPEATPLRLFTNQSERITLERGDSIQLVVSSDFLVERWIWNSRFGLSCIDCPNPLAAPTTDVVYNVRALAAGGCEVDTTIAFTVLDNRRYYAPTAFSPNSRGENQCWKIYPGPKTSSIEGFTIFDRWGGTLYRQTASLPPNDPRLAWDGRSAGRLLSSGTYAYTARLNFTDGSSRLVSGAIVLMN